jgi:hypothetical protein
MAKSGDHTQPNASGLRLRPCEKSLVAASRTSPPGTLTGSADRWTSVESRYDPIDLSATQATGVVAVGSSRNKTVGSFRSARAMAARGDGVEVGLSQGPAKPEIKRLSLLVTPTKASLGRCLRIQESITLLRLCR